MEPRGPASNGAHGDSALYNCDADGNNSVGIMDLSTVLLNWNTAGRDGDLDWSGMVGFADMSAVLSNFMMKGDQ